MQVGDKVYVMDWGKEYSTIYYFKDGKKQKVFPFVTDIPNYTGKDFHYLAKYEDNLTLKGTINKKDPRKLVSRTPIYKEFKYEILEIVQHSESGDNICLIRSMLKDRPNVLQCYITINEKGLIFMTPQEFEDEKFNALINYHLGRWTSETIDRKNPPEAIVSKVYDENDRVLFGSSVTRGKVSYNYIDAKFSKENEHIYLGSSVLYDGIGNADLPSDAIIMNFKDIKKMIEG